MTAIESPQSTASTAAGTGTGGRRLGLALFVIAAAQLMVVLDTAIVNVALPHMQQALGFSGTGLEWVVNGYALAFGGLMLLGGRAGDLLGRRRMADRSRTGANLAMACTGAALFGMFFFLTLFLQVVWGYPALKAGLAYLPMTAAIGVTSGVAAQLTPRIGARPVVAAGTVVFGGGLYWLSRLSVAGSYLHTILGPTLVAGAGLGLLFVPLTVVAMAKVAETESGVAASLRNTGQQVGGSIGLAILGTIAFTAAASNARASAARAMTAAARPSHVGRAARPGRVALAGIYHHALATGFARGFLIAAAVMLVALVITVATIRIRRADLAGVNPA